MRERWTRPGEFKKRTVIDCGKFAVWSTPIPHRGTKWSYCLRSPGGESWEIGRAVPGHASEAEARAAGEKAVVTRQQETETLKRTWLALVAPGN